MSRALWRPEVSELAEEVLGQLEMDLAAGVTRLTADTPDWMRELVEELLVVGARRRDPWRVRWVPLALMVVANGSREGSGEPGVPEGLLELAGERGDLEAWASSTPGRQVLAEAQDEIRGEAAVKAAQARELEHVLYRLVQGLQRRLGRKGAVETGPKVGRQEERRGRRGGC